MLKQSFRRIIFFLLRNEFLVINCFKFCFDCNQWTLLQNYEKYEVNTLNIYYVLYCLQFIREKLNYNYFYLLDFDYILKSKIGTSSFFIVSEVLYIFYYSKTYFYQCYFIVNTSFQYEPCIFCTYSFYDTNNNLRTEHNLMSNIWNS